MIFKDIEPGTTFYVFNGTIPLLKMRVSLPEHMWNYSTRNTVDLEAGEQHWIDENRRIKLSLDE